MVQHSKLSGFFNKRRGLIVRINIPPLAMGESKEYKTDCNEIKNKFRNYGCFNGFLVENTGDANLRILLDFNSGRSYDTDHIEKVSDTEFTEFVIINIDTVNNLLAGEAVIYIYHEDKYKRLDWLIDAALGGK